ncbi:zinc-dependent metalloprotease family protein [Lacibacter sediminis]|uniref:Matrixin family metalloprotease n=1 Tax=Lacibacter sediminis TaxID=2760713 RepID=A0A7G5XGG5_9BACT|nr:zinc-dependent metalloprotease family protein [Lacibacter sediminis]QNA44568.1 matrixin family metalloprotease [Lacibacter sediminis]
MKGKPIVILQPLQFDDTKMLAYLKDSIEKFYPVEIIIADVINFPANSYYKPRNRYRADSTIKWLRQIKPDSARTIVGITNEDVSVNKGAHKDYGVMGLGYKPGKSCVVSTYRLGKTATSQKHFQQRLFKVVVHEMGHNFGLHHCPTETCIMVDAEGQMKLDREKNLCGNCRRKLQIN